LDVDSALQGYLIKATGLKLMQPTSRQWPPPLCNMIPHLVGVRKRPSWQKKPRSRLICSPEQWPARAPSFYHSRGRIDV